MIADIVFLLKPLTRVKHIVQDNKAETNDSKIKDIPLALKYITIKKKNISNNTYER